jgi:hypothetical protein
MAPDIAFDLPDPDPKEIQHTSLPSTSPPPDPSLPPVPDSTASEIGSASTQHQQHERSLQQTEAVLEVTRKDKLETDPFADSDSEENDDIATWVEFARKTPYIAGLTAPLSLLVR